METSVQDRFNSLFFTGPKPSMTNSNGSHLFETKRQQIQQESSWKIPDVAQTPRKIAGPAPRPAGGDDILTSSDDDDYVSAFSQKPKMMTPKKPKRQKPKPRKLPEATALGYTAHIEAEGPIIFVPSGKSSEMLLGDDEGSDHNAKMLPTKDKLGNALTGHFCQFNLVRRFPYKYMVDSNDRVSRHFFANNKFFERTWDLYYIHPPESLNRDVLLLLPYSQVKVLLDQISTTFKAEVSVPGFPFTLSFFEDGTPYPQLLGTTMSRADINDMQDKIPSPPPSHGEAPADASSALDWSFAAFKQKLDKALAANKKKSTVVKQKKARDRFLVIQDWCKQLRRAQRYFGLRPIVGKVPEPDPNMTWAEQEAFIKGHEKKAHIDLEPLDVSKPAPFPFEQESVIVSIDIESYERNHKLITEIGVSTLDTLDLVGIAPGEGGEDWMKHIRSRHFRIKGREHYVNREFVTGHPDEFQFGESEFVTIEDAGKAVDSCFEWPFSFEYTHDSRLKDIIKDWSVGTASGSSHDIAPTTAREIKARYRDVLGLQKGPRKRAILLLGHDISTDLAYLSLLNSRTFSAPREPTYPAPMPDPTDMDNPIHSILEALDTATLFKVLCRESQTRSLTSIMGELGRTAWYAHCGGNDARYTLEALIGLVIKARIQDDEEKAAKAAALKEAFEQDPWQKEVASETASNSAVVNEDQTVETNGIDGHTNTLDTPRGISPPTHWEAERQRRLATRLAATTREVEEEFKAWDDALNHFTPQLTAESSSPANANTTNSYDIACNAIDDYGSPTPFAQVLQSTHEAKQKKAAKKTNKEKRREWDMKVREEDGVQGPVDWSVGGKDGCGK